MAIFSAFCTLPDGSRAGAYGVEEQNTAGMNCCKLFCNHLSLIY